jgi:hypothetical protein
MGPKGAHLPLIFQREGEGTVGLVEDGMWAPLVWNMDDSEACSISELADNPLEKSSYNGVRVNGQDGNVRKVDAENKTVTYNHLAQVKLNECTVSHVRSIGLFVTPKAWEEINSILARSQRHLGQTGAGYRNPSSGVIPGRRWECADIIAVFPSVGEPSETTSLSSTSSANSLNRPLASPSNSLDFAWGLYPIPRWRLALRIGDFRYRPFLAPW